MTHAESDENRAQAEGVAQAEAPPPEPEPEPAPEPWTPERALEWNRYYDMYVAAAVLLVAFLAASHKILGSGVWTMLQAGRLTAQQGWPVVSDPFSFTVGANARWVNISWLFGLANALLYDFARGLVYNANKPETIALADRVAAGALVALSASVRLLTALVVLNIRRAGPGLWWAAICALLALGSMPTPLPLPGNFPVTMSLGGVAGLGEVDPSGWGLLLLALELAILHSAQERGRERALLALPVLFLAWANVDESFLIGLVVLLAQVVGGLVRRDGPPRGLALAALGLSVAATFVNPSHVWVYPAALSPFLELFGPSAGELTFEQLSYFGPESQAYFDRVSNVAGAYRYFIAYYVLTVGLVLATFALNRRRFRLGRFLMVAVMAVLWAILRRFGTEFAVVGAVAAILNGQEWYHDRYGVAGRTGRGWQAFSTGGRALTILAVFFVVYKGLTGLGGAGADIQIGFGADPFEFAFEAADYLKDAPIRGNVLNLNLAHGDALIWRAWPTNKQRKTYIDSRRHVFPASLRAELHNLRQALRDGDTAAWRPVLDDRGITYVMMSVGADRSGERGQLYDAMARSPDWYEFYDDGKVILFGRADEDDVTRPDVPYFKEHRLDADELVYKRSERVPSTTQPPTPVSWVDRFFRGRAQASTQPHVVAAVRWLGARWNVPDTTPDAAHCIMAIRQARTALSYNPSDTYAFRMLNDAYKFLIQAETAVLAGSTGASPNDYLMFRFRQRVTALSYAIQTTPPPESDFERAQLADLHLEIAELFRGLGYLDLENDHLLAAQKLVPSDQLPEALSERIAQLGETVDRLQAQLEDFSAQQPNLAAQADAALRAGLVGTAINRLEQAQDQGVNAAAVKARLVDLYCQVGQPDKSFDVAPNIEDPALYTGPGTPAHRQGLISLLLGDYTNAAALWERAGGQLRASEASQALQAAIALVHGMPKLGASSYLEVPTMVRDEATWAFEQGLCLLEAGDPDGSAEQFTRALTLRPDLPSRDLMADYLKRMGKPVPEAPKAEALNTEAPKSSEAPKVEAPKAETPKASEAPKAEMPKAEAPKAEAPRTDAPVTPKIPETPKPTTSPESPELPKDVFAPK